MAVERLDRGEVLSVCRTAGAVCRMVGVAVGGGRVWLLFADRAVDGAEFEELLFSAIVLEVDLDRLV